MGLNRRRGGSLNTALPRGIPIVDRQLQLLASAPTTAGANRPIFALYASTLCGALLAFPVGMSHTNLFRQLRRVFRTASYCDARNLSTADGVAREGQDRRQFLGSVGALGALAGLAACGIREDEAEQATTHAGALDVGIVGAGLAGLVCADQLRQNGVTATVYEGNTRVGGRQYSLAGTFPGQVVERGGELIDTSQKNMINYARTFGLTLEDYLKEPGDIFYYLDGTPFTNAQIIDSYRAFVPAMDADLRGVSAAPTADTHNAYDVQIDQMSIADYLAARGADDVLSAVIEAAYVGEYGREITEQSALNFLLYIRADRRQKFEPFGTSDQRYHIVEGNDGVAKGLYGRVEGQVSLGMALTKVRQTASGQIELTFTSNGKTVVRTHDLAVLAIPFSVLRTLSLDASLALPDWKLTAVNELGYGTNAKNMVGFSSRPWAAQGNNGMIYATLANLQNSWETSWTTATPTSAVITNFTGGQLGVAQDPNKLQAQTAAFLADLDTVIPGAAAAATRDAKGNVLASMMAWPQNPWSRGSYTCYLTGQFTSIAGNEGKPIGNLYFAGEHCDSFYNQQGFMEGALASGTATAASILAAVKKAA
jgi:monoamine oxidase